MDLIKKVKNVRFPTVEIRFVVYKHSVIDFKVLDNTFFNNIKICRVHTRVLS